MLDGFMGREVSYKMGLKPWRSLSGNTIPVVIPLSCGFPQLRTKNVWEFLGRCENAPGQNKPPLTFFQNLNIILDIPQ
jgi:hypothetical protein